MIIIGTGPAGISAALYTLRAGINTTLVSMGVSALDKAREIENYYGFPMPISGPTLLADGINQARRLGAKFVFQEVVGIEVVDNDISVGVEENAGFIVKTSEYHQKERQEDYQEEYQEGHQEDHQGKKEHFAKVVILATGASRTKPKWQGIDNFEGMGVSYCALCDGFFFRGKDVAVAGSGPYALHEAQALLPLVRSVTLCSDGKELTADFPNSIKIVNQPVAGLEGAGALSCIRFKDGSALEVSGLFAAIGTAGSTELASTIGAEIQGGDITVDSHMRTSVPGLLAAGDCTGGMKQIAKAVYEGAVAGTEAVEIVNRM